MLEDHWQDQDIACAPRWGGGARNFCPMQENGSGVAGAPGSDEAQGKNQVVR